MFLAREIRCQFNLQKFLFFLGRKRDDKSTSNDRCVGNEDEILLEAEEFCADCVDYGEFLIINFNCVVDCFSIDNKVIDISFTFASISLYL